MKYEKYVKENERITKIATFESKFPSIHDEGVNKLLSEGYTLLDFKYTEGAKDIYLCSLLGIIEKEVL